MPKDRHSIGKRIGIIWTVKLTKVPTAPGRCFYTFQGMDAGRSASSFIDEEDVPPFEGQEAWFEVEQVSAKPWPFWRAIRQVDEPGPPSRR